MLPRWHGGGGRYAYTFESRSRTSGGGGFVIPASEIVPTGIESTAATIWFGEEMLRRYHSELPPTPP
jgi:hypothetical protein